MDAEQIIRMQGHLESQDSNFRVNWQDQANYIFPRERNITEIHVPGDVQFDRLYDITAVQESERMADGLLTYMVPAGQKFFGLATSDPNLQEFDLVKSYLADATRIIHEELESSNFQSQLKETFRSLIVFGTGCLYCSWNFGLFFRDWDIARYQIREGDHTGVVNTLYLKFPLEAIDAYGRWGDGAGQAIIDAMKDDKKHYENHWFIHVVKPREKFNPRFETVENMEYESVYVSCKDKIIVEEGGYPEFPYHVPRWAQTSGEIHGRGIGGMILPQVKMVNATKRDMNERSNKSVNPPMEVLETFEGEYDVTPGARNNTVEMPTARIDQFYAGSYQQDREELERERQVIKEACYHDAFAPLTDLTGDRRNELEIRQRITEGLRRIGQTRRLEAELFTPLIERVYFLLLENKVLGPPPAELGGTQMKINYKGQLSLAQQDSEASAAETWVSKAMEWSERDPSVMDHINSDSVMRRMARVGGVNEDDIRPEEEVESIREQRQAEVERQQALEAAQVAAGAYGQTTKAPEAGSAAEQLQNV